MNLLPVRSEYPHYDTGIRERLHYFFPEIAADKQINPDHPGHRCAKLLFRHCPKLVADVPLHNRIYRLRGIRDQIFRDPPVKDPIIVIQRLYFFLQHLHRHIVGSEYKVNGSPPIRHGLWYIRSVRSVFPVSMQKKKFIARQRQELHLHPRVKPPHIADVLSIHTEYPHPLPGFLQTAVIVERMIHQDI